MPIRSPRYSLGWIIGGNLALGLVLASATLMGLESDRATHVMRATQAADNLAKSLGIQIAAELHLVDNGLSTIAELRRNTSVPQHDIGTMVRLQAGLLPFVGTIRVHDAAGRLVHGQRASDATAVGPGDGYFRQAAQSQGTVVSEPVYDGTLQEWGVVLARRLSTPEGAFDGVVHAVLPASHFQAMFGSFAVGSGGAISLRSDTLRLAARYTQADPSSPLGLGGQEVSDELRKALLVNPQEGSFVTRTALDQVERINAYRRVPDYPLTVIAGFSTDSYLAPWVASARRRWAFTAAIIAVIAAGSFLLYRQQWKQYRVGAYASRLAKEQHALLENELVGMLKVRDRKILWANAAITSLLGHPKNTLIGGSTRILFPDEDAYERVGRAAEEAIAGSGRYRTELVVRTAQGADRWVEISGASVSESDTIWMVVDIHQLKRKEEMAQHLALHDPLTDLANRRLFEMTLHQSLLQLQRGAAPIAVCFLDLDGFKPINDAHGHGAGDVVLKAVAQRLRSALRANDSIARVGGDEFAWILSNAVGAAEVTASLQRCMEAIQAPIEVRPGCGVTVGCSVGIALSGRDGCEASRILKAADEAMYRAKHGGKGQYVIVASDGPDIGAQPELVGTGHLAEDDPGARLTVHP